jgi:hypothetical protein
MTPEEQRRVERWSPPVEVDMSPYIEYVQELQAECERLMHRRFSQLASDGYDPYNKQHVGRRYVYRILPDVVGSPAPDHSHATRKP